MFEYQISEKSQEELKFYSKLRFNKSPAGSGAKSNG